MKNKTWPWVELLSQSINVQQYFTCLKVTSNSSIENKLINIDFFLKCKAKKGAENFGNFNKFGLDIFKCPAWTLFFLNMKWYPLSSNQSRSDRKIFFSRTQAPTVPMAANGHQGKFFPVVIKIQNRNCSNPPVLWGKPPTTAPMSTNGPLGAW